MTRVMHSPCPARQIARLRVLVIYRQLIRPKLTVGCAAVSTLNVPPVCCPLPLCCAGVRV